MLPYTRLLILSLIFDFCSFKLVKTNSISPPNVLLGASCFDDFRNLNGTCKSIADCPNIVTLKLNGRRYVSCGFENRIEVVCCGERVEEPEDYLDFPNAHMKYVQKCKEYASVVFNEWKCNYTSTPLVVGGEDARLKEFPHMALIGCSDDKENITWICGGSLISNRYILSASHCVANPICDDITDVRLGELNVKSENDGSQHRDYKVERSIMHPDYKKLIRYNDIALIKLAEDVQFNEFIRPACLPYRDYTDTYQLLVTGWGSTDNGDPKSDILQKAPVEPFTQEECNKTWTEDDGDEGLPIGVRERVQICAGSKDSNKDTCQGDSGGPLQIVHPNYPCMYSVVGVTASGQSCGNAGVPAIYTRTFYYIYWIQKIVWD